MPLKQNLQAKSIECQQHKVQAVHPGDICEIQLHFPAGFDPEFIRKGHVLCDPQYPIHQVTEFRAKLVVFETPKPLFPGYKFIVYCFANQVPGSIVKLESIMEPKSGETIKKNPMYFIFNDFDKGS